MEVSNYSRAPSERLELKYDKFTIKKDPKLKVKEVIYSDDPCACCGGQIEEKVIYEQVVNVTGYMKVPRALVEESGEKIQESSIQLTSSGNLKNLRENEEGSAKVGPVVDETAGDPAPGARKRERRHRGDRIGHRQRRRQDEAISRKIAGVTKKEWNQLKKHIRGQME